MGYLIIQRLPPFKSMEGNLAPNNKLESAKHIGIGRLKGPEMIAFAANGAMLASLMTGEVVKVYSDGRIERLVRIGDEKNETLCDDFEPFQQAHESCGRPLGLRLRGDWLYLADAFNGLLKVNIITG